MKKLIFALLVSLAAALVAQPPAGAGVEKIVYDTCHGTFDGMGSWWDFWCGIVMADPDGSNTVRVGEELGGHAKWSPDGSKIAFGDSAIFVLNLADGNLTNLTTPAWGAAWSRDGAQIAFVSDRPASTTPRETNGPAELYVMNVDGSGLTRLTFNVGFVWRPGWQGFIGLPAWFPDGGRIAFDCEVESGNVDICAINADGTGLVRLTTDPGLDFGAAFSRDGRMAFATTRFGAVDVWGFPVREIAIMDVAGTVSRLGAGVAGWGPTWAPDGTRLAYVCDGPYYLNGSPLYGLCVVNADGTGASPFGVGNSPDWGLTPTSVLPPTAAVTYSCRGLTCQFDGSGSADPDGTITSYAWVFGDGTTGSGATVGHTYVAGGAYLATLTVTDNGGATGIQSQSVTVVVNAPPVASFTSTCSGLTCSFDGSGSSDADGTITSRAWSFGDGATGSGTTVGHPYAAGGTYTVTLTVTDTGGATATRGQNVTVSPAFMHVGDLDGASTTQGTTWTALATITVHDSAHRPVTGATVSGAWGTGGTGSCTTSATGQCAVSKSTIPKKAGTVVFTVVNVTHAMLAYKSGDNHDPDRDSSGTRITVKRP